jgi:uncharacterized protein YbjQ (UPF0145 family)
MHSTRSVAFLVRASFLQALTPIARPSRLRQARETAMEEMGAEAGRLGAHAVIGVHVDDKSIQIGREAAC